MSIDVVVVGTAFALVSGFVLYVNKKIDDINKDLECEIYTIRSDISEIKTDIKWIRNLLELNGND